MKTRILAFAGSTRSGSYNKLFSHVGVEAAREAGAEVTWIDLRDLKLPLYDGDDEEANGLPEGAKTLKRLMIESHGFLISSPEYNSSISGVLKNAIDWASRTETDEEPDLVAYTGKIAGLMSASPGALGGLRGLVTLRSLLGNIGVFVLPDQVTLPKAHEAFDDHGKLKDARKQQQVEKLAQRLVSVAGKLRED